MQMLKSIGTRVESCGTPLLGLSTRLRYDVDDKLHHVTSGIVRSSVSARTVSYAAVRSTGTKPALLPFSMLLCYCST